MKSKLITLAVIMTLAFCIPTVFAGPGATIEIPSAGISQPVITSPLRDFGNGVVTWDVSALGARAGYYQGTAWFGQGGNTVLGMHSELANRVTSTGAKLYNVAAGDEIIVTVDGSQIRYTVSDVFTVPYTDIGVIMPTSDDRLTLMTCHIPSYQNGVYLERLIVVAHRTN